MLIKQENRESWSFYKKRKKVIINLCGMQNGAKSKYTLKYNE